jgi:diketogulonate reductase-like aldo/keto reductase
MTETTTGAPAHRTRKLNTGAEIPRVGLGVFQAPRGEVTRAAVRAGIELGYRHIDTARVYSNEADVGAAVREAAVPRAEIFVTTKLWNADQGHDEALRAFDASLARLGLDYVDLYLIHWPVPELRLESWRALEAIHASGRARAIGVSNFMVHHIEELLARAQVVPAVNQIEVSPFLQQRDVRAFCAARGIAVEAYSPLTKGERLDHPVVRRIAGARGLSAAQVLLGWGLQRDLIILPKSVTPARLAENLAVLDLPLAGEHLAALDALEEGLVTGWDPRDAP